MTTRTYNLRSRKINTTYIESSSNKVVKGRTSYYNNYEKIGIIESLTDKAYIRYGYNSITLNVNEFLNTYNEFISNSEILICRVNNIIEPINCVLNFSQNTGITFLAPFTPCALV